MKAIILLFNILNCFPEPVVWFYVYVYIEARAPGWYHYCTRWEADCYHHSTAALCSMARSSSAGPMGANSAIITLSIVISQRTVL